MFLFRPLILAGCACLVFVPLAAVRAQSQAAAPLPNAPGNPPPFPTLPLGALPVRTTSAVPGTENGEVANVKLQFSNTPITDVLDIYAALSGKRVIADNSVQGQINLNITTPVTPTQAIRIIETVLSLNGFALVPAEGNIVKVLGLGKPVRSAGVPIFSELSQVPHGEQIVSFLLRLRYLDPQETAGVLQQYVPPTSNTVFFTALEKAGALIITDDADSVRRLVDLVTSLDNPLAPVTERFFTLQRADATKAVEFLNAVFENKTASSTGNGAPGAAGANPPGRRPIRRDDASLPIEPVAIPGQPNGLIPLSGDSIIQGRITLTADIRTNRVHVVTSPLNMPLVAKLLEEYDADTPFAEPVRRPLRFVSASDVLPILVQTLTEPGTDNASGTNPTGTQAQTPQRPNSSSNGGGLNGSASSTNSSSSSSSDSSSDIGNGELNTSAVDTKPSIAVVGNTKIIADQRSNTIILLGSAEAKDKVFATLDQLDVRAPQVIIRTVIGELSLSTNYELGFNYLLRTNRGSILSQYGSSFLPGSATPVTNANGTTTDTSAASTLNSFSTLASGVASGFTGVGGILTIGKSFDIILSALEATNRFKTISRPMIFASNNKEAIIASGQEIAVPTGSVGSLNTSGSSTGVYTNVEFKNVVLQLEVVPLINSEHEVTLDIVQKIDSVVAGSTTTVNGTAVPTIATRKLKSTVSAPNNSTIVLGGLITQDTSVSDNNIPYLSKIPVLGNLFKSHTRDATRSELIILLHPEVVNTPELLARARANEEHRTYLGGDLEEQLLPIEVRKATPVTPRATTTTTTTVHKTTAPVGPTVVPK